jgi:hypothetical protein
LKPSKKVAFLTTAFPVDGGVANDYFQSIKKQTYQGFDLVILNDGFAELAHYKKTYSSLNIIELDAAGSIAKNREALIKYVILAEYDIAVFGDFDDYFDVGRIEVALDLLQEADVVVNDLCSFDDSGVLERDIIGNRFCNRQHITVDMVMDKNIFGLSNTAVRLNGMSDLDISFDSSLVAVDWYFFSILLLSGWTSVFTNETFTHYRQHSDNTVGMMKSSADSIRKAVDVKTIHYAEMLQHSRIFKEYFENTKKLKIRIEDEEFFESLQLKNKIGLSSPLWWEILE